MTDETVTHGSHSATADHSDLFVARGHHGATDKQYIVIAAILALVTAAEVSLTYMDVGAFFLPALLILMAAKFLVVVSYFMHLKFDSRLFSFLFYMGLVLAVGVYSIALATFSFFSS